MIPFLFVQPRQLPFSNHILNQIPNSGVYSAEVLICLILIKRWEALPCFI